LCRSGEAPGVCFLQVAADLEWQGVSICERRLPPRRAIERAAASICSFPGPEAHGPPLPPMGVSQSSRLPSAASEQARKTNHGSTELTRCQQRTFATMRLGEAPAEGGDTLPRDELHIKELPDSVGRGPAQLSTTKHLGMGSRAAQKAPGSMTERQHPAIQDLERGTPAEGIVGPRCVRPADRPGMKCAGPM
jgi:hypothetical protein